MNSSKEDSDHLSKLQKQNGEEYKDAAKEVEDTGKRKGKKTKQSMQRKQKKRKFEETEKDENDKRDWNDNETIKTSSESTSFDSITGKSMSLAIFDLTLNERMNGFACWMKHVGCSPRISAFLPRQIKCRGN